MTAFPYSVSPEATLAEAQSLMLQHAVRHLPVMDEHSVVGLLSDRDMKAALAEDSDGSGAHTPSVGDVCVRNCYVVDLHAPLAEVLRTMVRLHIGAAVVTARGRLAGIFTAMDACRTLADEIDRHYPVFDGPDEVA